VAKRFTDTTKWKRPWFRNLNTEAKLLWVYLCDECDHAGIFLADFTLISFQLGFEVSLENLKLWLGDKVVQIAEDKFFIPSFLDFQYGQTDNKFRAKQSAYSLLANYNLLDESGSLKDLTNSYLRLSEDLAKSLGIGISKSKSILKRGGGGKTFKPDLESVYRDYPRKEGKSSGMKTLRGEIKTPEDFALLKQAVSKYRESLKTKGTKPEFILLWSSFCGQWRDWLEPDAGKAEDFSKSESAFNFSEADRAYIFERNEEKR
jgi:hypothetical protein